MKKANKNTYVNTLSNFLFSASERVENERKEI